jgi:hypothetical protein
MIDWPNVGYTWIAGSAITGCTSALAIHEMNSMAKHNGGFRRDSAIFRDMARTPEGRAKLGMTVLLIWPFWLVFSAVMIGCSVGFRLGTWLESIGEDETGE